MRFLFVAKIGFGRLPFAICLGSGILGLAWGASPARYLHRFCPLWAPAARYLLRFLPVGARAAVFNAASATGVAAVAVATAAGMLS